MSPTIRSLVIPISELEAAKAVYTALLGAPHTDQPNYVGYNVDGFEISLAPGDVAGGPVAYADVEDLDATRANLRAAGATERSAPRRVAPEARVCVLADADGNPLGLRGRKPSEIPPTRAHCIHAFKDGVPNSTGARAPDSTSAPIRCSTTVGRPAGPASR